MHKITVFGENDRINILCRLKDHIVVCVSQPDVAESPSLKPELS